MLVQDPGWAFIRVPRRPVRHSSKIDGGRLRAKAGYSHFVISDVRRWPLTGLYCIRV